MMRKRSHSQPLQTEKPTWVSYPSQGHCQSASKAWLVSGVFSTALILALEHVAEDENALFIHRPIEAFLMGEMGASDSRTEAITAINADTWLESLPWITVVTPKKANH